MPLFHDTYGDYQTSARTLLACHAWLKANPHGEIATGIWTSPRWTKQEFDRWFSDCLNAKINSTLREQGRKYQPDYQNGLKRDSRTIADYGQRIRHHGCANILRTPELRIRFPQINTQEWEE